MTLEAIPPTLLGSKIHLFSAGYQPGPKKRRDPDRNMCGQFTSLVQWERRIPLAEAVALGWGTEGFTPATPDYVHVWKHWAWCRGCIGHAAAETGLLAQVIAMLVKCDNEKCQPDDTRPS